MKALEQGLAPPDPAAPAEADDLGELEIWRQDDGEWRTCFPPPADFDGFEEGEWDGVSWYCRALTAREQAAIDSDMAAERAQACARRDRFFGFAEDGISAPMEAEPSEAFEPSDEPCPGAAPLEYKSLTLPRRTASPRGPRPAPRHPGESRDLGEAHRDFLSRGPGVRRDDDSPPAHIQTPRSRHPC